MSRKSYLKYILVFGVLSVAIAVIAVMTARRTPAPGPAATAEQATPPDAPPIHAADDEPAIEQPASEQPAEEQPTFETFAPDDDLDFVLELSEIIDNREDDFKERERERVRKARDKLTAKLSQPGAKRTALLEEFLDEFGIGAETYRQATMLAEAYDQAGRLDDARRLYRDVLASLSAFRGLFNAKQSVGMQLAGMEQRADNLAAAEKLLLGVIETPIPGYYANSPPWALQDLQIQKEIDAQQLLAEVYVQAGRFEDASKTLDAVIAAALALEKDHGSFGSIPYYVSRAYRGRIELLLVRTQPDGIDEAMEAAFALVDDYEKSLAGIAWRNPERTMNSIASYKDHLRMLAVRTACHKKIEALLESADASSLDEAVAAADKLVEEYKALGNKHAWHRQSTADEFRRRMDRTKDWASKTAEKKRAEP